MKEIDFQKSQLLSALPLQVSVTLWTSAPLQQSFKLVSIHNNLMRKPCSSLPVKEEMEVSQGQVERW